MLYIYIYIGRVRPATRMFFVLHITVFDYHKLSPLTIILTIVMTVINLVMSSVIVNIITATVTVVIDITVIVIVLIIIVVTGSSKY